MTLQSNTKKKTGTNLISAHISLSAAYTSTFIVRIGFFVSPISRLTPFVTQQHIYLVGTAPLFKWTDVPSAMSVISIAQQYLPLNPSLSTPKFLPFS